MKHFFNFLSVVILGSFLISCQTIDKKANKAISVEEAKLSKWLNQSVSELKIEFGQPDLVEENAEGEVFFIYKSKKYLIKCERKFEKTDLRISQSFFKLSFTFFVNFPTFSKSPRNKKNSSHITVY